MWLLKKEKVKFLEWDCALYHTLPIHRLPLSWKTSEAFPHNECCTHPIHCLTIAGSFHKCVRLYPLKVGIFGQDPSRPAVSHLDQFSSIHFGGQTDGRTRWVSVSPELLPVFLKRSDYHRMAFFRLSYSSAMADAIWDSLESRAAAKLTIIFQATCLAAR